MLDILIGVLLLLVGGMNGNCLEVRYDTNRHTRSSDMILSHTIISQCLSREYIYLYLIGQ